MHIKKDFKKRKADVIKKNNIFWISFFFLFVFLYSFYKASILGSFINNKYINSKDLKNIKSYFLSKTEKKDSFKNLYTAAKSYVVYDLEENKIISSKNENEILPLASLTKVISAMTALNLKDKNTEIIIKKSLMRTGETLDLGMKDGQVWKMGELLKYALTISSNASMDIIASTISTSNSKFIEEMNIYTQGLGYKTLHFNSASGLDYGSTLGGVGSALDFAKIFALGYKTMPSILSYTTNSKIDLKLEKQKIYQIPNTNQEASKMVALLASKTGFTDAAGGNLAIMFTLGLNKQIVIVVLGSTISGRFQDVNTLYQATLKYFD